jgi:hypothetical protein
MTLKVWRTTRHRYLAECDACGSRGTPGRVEVTARVDPGSEAARAAVLAEAQRTRLAYEAELRGIANLQRSGKLKPADAGPRIKARATKHAADLRDALAQLPELNDGVVETVARCPWCGDAADATVQRLAEGAHEPPHWTKGAA